MELLYSRSKMSTLFSSSSSSSSSSMWNCLFIFASILIQHTLSSSPESADPYLNHCYSIVPQYTTNGISIPFFHTSYFTTGDTFPRPKLDWGHYNMQRNLYYSDKHLSIQFQPHYNTTIQASLTINIHYMIDSPEMEYDPLNPFLTFSMNGLWSEKSRNLCMVGSATWNSNLLHAVLKLNFDQQNPTMYTALVRGSLESTASSANDPSYFEPILIFDFPQVSNYTYTFSLKEAEEISNNLDVGKEKSSSSLSVEARDFCSVMSRMNYLELEYAERCRGARVLKCSPLDNGVLPHFLSLTSIQCSEGETKARFIATFLNYTTYDYDYDYDSFSVSSTMIGEAFWDNKNNRVIGMACRLLRNTNEVKEDCSMRLILRYPSVLTLRSDAKVVGQIWSPKGDFTPINLRATNEGSVTDLPDQRYEYTELDRARNSCKKKALKKLGEVKGNVYPDEQSYDMRLHLMHIKNGQGEVVGWASGMPTWVGNDSYKGGGPVDIHTAKDSASAAADTLWLKNISYHLRIYPYYYYRPTSNVSLPMLDWPVYRHAEGVGVEITAEGIYDQESGHLCLVGCRKLVYNSTYILKDCEIAVEFQLPRSNEEEGGLIKGMLRSMRSKTDPLHFDDLLVGTPVYGRVEAEQINQRTDMKKALVLWISNTLLCISVALQIFHVKRNPEVTSYVSLAMLVIFLVSNFEAAFSNYYDRRIQTSGSDGSLGSSEAKLEVITMVALLLQLCLLQLVLTKRQRKRLWSAEDTVDAVSLSLYILGGLLYFVMKRNDGWEEYYHVWGYVIRAYVGVSRDGFLVPQILVNMFSSLDLGEKAALCDPFYIGTSMVSLVPHAYNVYRFHNFKIKLDMEEAVYANAAGDLYTTAWDMVMPRLIIGLAVIVFLQKRYGGRCILPQWN